MCKDNFICFVKNQWFAVAALAVFTALVLTGVIFYYTGFDNGQEDINLIITDETIESESQGPVLVELEEVSQDVVAETTYIVQKGDNLTKIAKTHGTTIKELVDANDISNPNFIREGTELIIPGAPRTSDKV